MTRRRHAPSLSRALRLHVPLVLGVALCSYAGWFELVRARAGHTVAWVYVFEWPAFAVAGVVIWWRVVTGRDEVPRERRDGGSRDIEDDDPGLQAWKRYKAAVEERDGGSPDGTV